MYINSATANAAYEPAQAPQKDSIRAHLDEINDLSEKILCRLCAADSNIFSGSCYGEEVTDTTKSILTVEDKLAFLHENLLKIDALSERLSRYFS